MIGQIVNYRYEVLEKVGDGALFSVYKSRDKVLNRLVALKVLSKELAANGAFAAAVREGYQQVAALDHPSVARVLDADSSNGETFVACEYVRGTDVKERVRRAGPMSVPLALEIIIPVLEALEFAHANGIVHGDVRSKDIVVSPDGEVKLTDFGLADALAACPEVADRFAMRSVHYAAPETAEGAAPSPASDLYAVGVVLYEMLTGVLPFGAATAVAVALRRAKELPTPPRAINTSVPKSVSDLVMRALEKNPADRFPSAAAMLADLRAIRDALRMGKPLSIPQATVSAGTEREPYAPPVEAAEPSPWRLYLLLIVIFVVAVVVSLGLTMYLGGERGKVQLPMLIGDPFDQARDKAGEVGLELVEGEEVYSDVYEAGEVVNVYEEIQTAGGKRMKVIQPAQWVSKGAIVMARVSKGPRRKAVPDLVGLPEAEAYRVADTEEFAITKRTTEYSDKVPVNSVISQSPNPGSMRPRGSPISLVISLGPKPETGSTDETMTGADLGDERKFNVAVEVPPDADGSQEVRIVIVDTRGETAAYRRYHQPGDKFTQPVVTYGSTARIMVYVGGELVSDNNY